MTKRIKLTKTKVADLAPVAGKAVMVWDTEVRGFGVRVSPGGAKAFILQRRIGTQERRMTIARVEDMTLDDARKAASKLVAQVVDGIDPKAEAKRQAIRTLTLGQAFENYAAAPVTKMGASRGDPKKARTVRDIRMQAGRFADWHDKQLREITEDMVKERHAEIAKVSPAQANLAMKYLRAALNFAILNSPADDPILRHNPVDRLNRTATWAKVEPAKGHVPVDRLAEFVEQVRTGLIGLRHEAEHRDATLFMLLTGARHAEVMGDRKSGYRPLQWSQVDLDAARVTLPDPKNRRPFTIHLARQVVDMLRARQKVSGKRGAVFANAGGEVIEDMRSAQARLEAAMGFRVTSHDLRRTYATAASVCATAFVLKALLNHVSGGDVTTGYVQIDPAEVARTAQVVVDFILSPDRKPAAPPVVGVDAV